MNAKQPNEKPAGLNKPVKPVHVRIIGDHPWAGYVGIAISIEKPKIGFLPRMVRVRLTTHCAFNGHECFAGKENIEIIKGV